MKYNLSKIMLKAWKVYRKTKNIRFAEALHRAWLQLTYEVAKLFQIVMTDENSTLSKEDWKRYFIITKLFMISDLRHLECIDSFTNGLMGS